MRIERFIPTPAPSFTMTFTREEGWALVAALSDWADKHPDAASLDEWKQWATDLTRELRR
jgi:hypothetical protein